MSEKKLMIYKANNLTEATYRLSLDEQRVILACIGQVNSSEPLLATDKFELDAKDFAVMFGIDENAAYGQLIAVAENLYKRELIIDRPDHKTRKLKTRWISSISYLNEEGKIALWFSVPILPYLSDLKTQFTRYDLENIRNMTSIYGIRLYELLMQWQTTGSREIEVMWLRQHFEISDLYPQFSDFKKRVVEPAVDNINKHTNLTVKHEYKKSGRNVTHIQFTFKDKVVRKPRTPKTSTPEKVIIDNLEYFADMRKRFGDKAEIPKEFEDALRKAGRWL